MSRIHTESENCILAGIIFVAASLGGKYGETE
jgi:hypothetical protein